MSNYYKTYFLTSTLSTTFHPQLFGILTINISLYNVFYMEMSSHQPYQNYFLKNKKQTKSRKSRMCIKMLNKSPEQNTKQFVRYFFFLMQEKKSPVAERNELFLTRVSVKLSYV